MTDITRRDFIKASTAAVASASLARPAVAQTPIIIPDVKITKIRKSAYPVSHPRKIGPNSKKDHPREYQQGLVRVMTDAGIEGVGNDAPASWIGMNLNELLIVQDGFLAPNPSGPRIRPAEQSPLIDIVGKLTKRPSYELIGSVLRTSIPVYDGTIYMRDIDGGVEEVKRNIEDGMAAGHTAFKLKIGRGNWMRETPGLKRDIEIVHLARRTVGPDAQILVDANDHYSLRQAQEFIEQTRDLKLYWAEEMFSEAKGDDYRKLYDFIRARSLKTLLADGEGTDGGGELMSRIEDGVVRAVQPDIRDIGIFEYRDYARKVDGQKASIAPHTWAKQIGEYEAMLLGAVTPNFLIAEVARLTSPVLSLASTTVKNGHVDLPETPGLAVRLEEGEYRRICGPTEQVHS
jgi:L-alanine-DL-glutamate epimerase-like enolase superfamily enzyme